MTPRILLTLCLAACAGSETASAPPAPPAPAGAPAPSPAPGGAAAEAPVGPDGPEDLAVPEFVVDPATAEAGKAVFDAKGCGACHQFGTKLVGPDLSGLGERRSHKWIARMIRHPGDMVKRDPVAKQMFRELMVEMSNQGVSDEELGPLISFLVSHPAAK